MTALASSVSFKKVIDVLLSARMIFLPIGTKFGDWQMQPM